MILLQLLVLISPAYGLFCEPRWTLFENSCYKRFESATPHNTCRTFRSLLLQNVTASEVDFIAKITLGKPMANRTGDFVCKKNAVPEEVVVTRTRPMPRNDLYCGNVPNWFGLSDTKRCYSMQFNHYPFTWEEANARCQNWFNGTLATMRTEVEYNQVIRVAHFGTYGLTFEQPLVGYRRTSNQWKWIGGSQEGITNFHGGIPDPKLNQNCAQLTTDIVIQPDHQVVYNAQFGSMVPVPCDQRFQRYVCSSDQATFVKRYPGTTTTTSTTTTTTTTPTTTTAPEPYCPDRWTTIGFGGKCMRSYQTVYGSDCSEIGGQLSYCSIEFEGVYNQYPFSCCNRTALYGTPVANNITLPAPKNDLDCFEEGWTGVNKTLKCLKRISVTSPVPLEKMRESCERFGGTLAKAMDYIEEQEFIAQIGHIGVSAFFGELPVLDYGECGMASISDFVIDEDVSSLGGFEERPCFPGNNYICEVDYEEMKLRNGG